MNFLELVKARQSVRGYLEKLVEREKIERILEAARLAPSACNSQPWTFVVVDDPKLKEDIARETFSQFLSMNHFSVKAPVLILIVSEREKWTSRFGSVVKDKDFKQMDIGIAAEHMCLQATEEGLGSCMLGWFDEKGVKRILKIPKKKRVELIITIGYPESEKIRQKNRKKIEKVASFNKYEVPS